MRYIYSCIIQRKLKQCHRDMQPVAGLIMPSGSRKPKGAGMRGHLGLGYAIGLSREMLLDDVNDHGGDCLKVGRLGLKTCDVNLFEERRGSSVAHVCLSYARLKTCRAPRRLEDMKPTGDRTTSQANPRSCSTSSSQGCGRRLNAAIDSTLIIFRRDYWLGGRPS